MSFFVWTVWAAQGSNEEEKNSEQLLRVVFQLFVGKIVVSSLKIQLKYK
jgi:hypothetical protein